MKPWRLYFTGIVTGILLLSLAMLVCDMLGLHPLSRTTAADSVYDLTKVVETYVDKYYWKNETTDEKFADFAAKGMIAALGDPFSAFMTNEELDMVKTHNDGEYIGIGVTISTDPTSGEKKISAVTDGSPAQKAGMKVGDVIIGFDGEKTDKISVDDIIVKIREKKGLKHTIKVNRTDENGKPEILDIVVIPESIVNKSISYKMLKNKIGYIKIESFDRETPKQFDKAMDELEKQGQKAVIFDLRNNPGGVLTAVLSMLDRLLPEGTLLTETRKGQKDIVYKSTAKERFDKPMLAMINGGSASGAEAFAGAISERAGAKLVGETSYGKGIVQAMFRLPDKRGGVKLTTGEYLLPNGTHIHEKGLKPDVEIPFTGEKTDYGTEKDNQLSKAIEIISLS
jgi:carboxyl-terminal processing protease